MVALLTGPDRGPNPELVSSNWNKKIISISTNRMIIEFKSDGFKEEKGFSAKIHFTQVPNNECESWLDVNKKIFKSPNYPQTFHSVKKCSWFITMDPDYHITLKFFEFYVRHQMILSSDYF